MKKIDTQMTTTAIAQCSIFVVLMMLTGTVIKIPFPLVPLTFQTLVSVLSGLLLGWKKGLYAMLAYLILGLIGIPVFAAGGGIFYIVKPSFGYIIGFVLGAVVAGLIRGRDIKAPFWRYVLGGVGGFIANYAIGILYFIVVWLAQYGETGLGAAIISYNVVYMPKDIVLCILGAIVSWKVAPVVIKKYKESQLVE